MSYKKKHKNECELQNWCQGKVYPVCYNNFINSLRNFKDFLLEKNIMCLIELLKSFGLHIKIN